MNYAFNITHCPKCSKLLRRQDYSYSSLQSYCSLRDDGCGYIYTSDIDTQTLEIKKLVLRLTINNNIIIYIHYKFNALKAVSDHYFINDNDNGNDFSFIDPVNVAEIENFASLYSFYS